MRAYIYDGLSDASDNSALVELLAGIEDRRIRRKVKKLVEFGAEAVRSLGELDSALYSRENGEDQLQIISDAVLSHVRRLLSYLASVAPSDGGSVTTQELDIQFATGDSLDLTDAVAAVLEKVAQSGEEVPKQASDDEKWSELAAEMDSIQYALGSELKDLDRRFAEALKLDRKGQALQDLNDAVNSLMDGVFAMMTTVYELFLGHADPDRMIPGYRDTLGKALAVRRMITELGREVQELNRTIQDTKANPMVVEMSYSLLVESLERFVGATEFHFLRPGDREEFAEVCEKLRGGSAERNRFDCEGLDKYLDSLAVVSQRDVLIKHDSDLRKKITEELEKALPLIVTAPQKLPGLVSRCFEQAEKLFGLKEELDSLVYRWSTLGAVRKEDPGTVLELGNALKALVELPKKTPPPPPSDGDFF